MARIKWTSYRFNKPALISELEYNSIKTNQKTNPNYNPFYVESFFNKFKIQILAYVIGSLIAAFLFSVGEELNNSEFVLLEYFGGFLMFITGFFGAILFFWIIQSNTYFIFIFRILK